MISADQEIRVQVATVEPFEDRIDILYRELELATKWERPSVLLVIFSSEYVHTDAEVALENRLAGIGQTIHRLKIKDSGETDITLLLSKAGKPQERVFFVDGLRRANGKTNVEAYRALNTSREFFVENRVRIVFWLTEREAIDLAHYAPDYWAFRHRVIEFVEPPRPEQLSSRALQLSSQGIGEFTDTADDIDEKISLRTALLADLPAGDESTAPRADLQLTLGVLYWRRGDFEKATEFLNDTLRLTCLLNDDWSQALCLNALALVQTDLDRFEEAVETYQRAALLAPEHLPWNNLGKLYARLNRHQEAMEVLQKAIENNPRDPDSWHGLGEIYCALDRHQEAEAAFRKVLELAPDHAFAWNGLGNVYVETGQPNEAITAFQKALQMDQRIAASWLGLGRAFRLLRQDQNAITAYKMVIGIEPRNAQAWSEMGDLQFDAEAYDQAALAYRKAIDLCEASPSGDDRHSAHCYINLGDIYSQQEKYADAILLYQTAIELTGSPDERAVLWNLVGDAYRRANDYDNAIAAYRKADELDPESAAFPDMPAQPEEAPAPAADEAPVAETDPAPEIQPEASLADQEAEPLPGSDQGPAATPVQFSAVNDFTAWLDDLGSLPPAPEVPSTEPAPKLDPAASESEPAIEAETAIGPESGNPEDEANVSGEAEPTPELPVETEQENPVPEPLSAQAAVGPEQPLPATNLEPDLPATQLEPAATVPDPTLEDTQPMRRVRPRTDPRNAQIWNELGNIYFNAGAEDDAIGAFQKAIDLDPSYGWSYSNLATIYVHKGRYAEAIPLFRKGIELLRNAKDQALLWNRLGDAYRRLNDPENATIAYGNATELDPSNTSLLTRARFSLLGNCKAQ
jgi:tetratricopeptide (TPR) repeat protein